MQQEEASTVRGGSQVLILGAGRMCEPAVKYLTSTGRQLRAKKDSHVDDGSIDERVSVVVASLFIEDAQKAQTLPSLTLRYRRLYIGWKLPLIYYQWACNSNMFLGLQVVAGVPNTSAIQLDTADVAKLEDCVSKVM